MSARTSRAGSSPSLSTINSFLFRRLHFIWRLACDARTPPVSMGNLVAPPVHDPGASSSAYRHLKCLANEALSIPAGR